MHVISTEKLPIKIWATPEHALEHDDVLQQARNLANHPLARKWVCLMPDFHLGFGMPIGGVVATRGGVIPNAVGVDIGCGMIAAQTSIEADAITVDQFRAWQARIYETIPVGLKSHETAQDLPERLVQPFALHDPALERQARFQIGTLGGGNHFIELQRDPEGRLWIMLHSGSRGIGKKTCDHFHAIAKAYMRDFHAAIPDIDLAFLPDSVPEYRAYMGAMEWCMRFAEENRKLMFDRTVCALREAIGVDVEAAIQHRFDTHHNFAAIEHHFGENLLIHRKGAVKATSGDWLTIPGSMGTASYIGAGLSPAESFNTCSHGAGRVLGRREANRTITHERAVESMSHVVYGVRQGNYDEMPDAYKDVDTVMAQQADLVQPRYRLTPLAVAKG